MWQHAEVNRGGTVDFEAYGQVDGGDNTKTQQSKKVCAVVLELAPLVAGTASVAVAPVVSVASECEVCFKTIQPDDPASRFCEHNRMCGECFKHWVASVVLDLEHLTELRCPARNRCERGEKHHFTNEQVCLSARCFVWQHDFC
jgi:hypothetical protein